MSLFVQQDTHRDRDTDSIARLGTRALDPRLEV